MTIRQPGVLAGWGRMPVVPGQARRAESLVEATADVPLTRGCGRAYGDAALPAPRDLQIAESTLADRVLSFDVHTGSLRAEAGVTLDTLYKVFLPRGFFTPVTPGTRFVTLGGMVACDVHGKNHHRDGCFGQHVQRIILRLADGSIVACSAGEHADLFYATIGGMGLTGHILEITFTMARVPSSWIVQETEPVAGIGQFLESLEQAASVWPMTMGWIDCVSTGPALGRGILYKGRWATVDEAPRHFSLLRPQVPIPFSMPSGFLSPLLVRAFNTAYYAVHRAGTSIVHPAAFFYPLDILGQWNRLYGRRGLAQYQCVLPASSGPGVARRVLDIVAQAGAASPLCVIKDCGLEGKGLLSFPKPGISIALDFPMRDTTQALVDRLNDLVAAEGGRIYLAKDALTRADHFRAMEPRLDAFLAARRTWDPAGRIRSAQSVRLFGW